MKYVIGALQWKLPRAPLPFNPALFPVGVANRMCFVSLSMDVLDT